MKMRLENTEKYTELSLEHSLICADVTCPLMHRRDWLCDQVQFSCMHDFIEAAYAATIVSPPLASDGFS